MNKRHEAAIQQMKHTKWIPKTMEGSGLLIFQCGHCKFSFLSDKIHNTSFRYCPSCGDKMDENSTITFISRIEKATAEEVVSLIARLPEQEQAKIHYMLSGSGSRETTLENPFAGQQVCRF